MKAKELAEILLENPDAEVSVSVDVSTCEGDSGRRAFGEDVFEVIEGTTGGPHGVVTDLTICLEGYLND